MIMEFYSVTISTTSTELKETTMNLFWWFVKLFLMENVSLCWEEILKQKTTKFGILIVVNVTIFLQRNTIHFVVSLSMKNKLKDLIEGKIHVLLLKLAVLFQGIMFIIIFRILWDLSLLTLTSRNKNCGSLSWQRDQERNCLIKVKLTQFKLEFSLIFILSFKGCRENCHKIFRIIWKNI